MLVLLYEAKLSLPTCVLRNALFKHDMGCLYVVIIDGQSLLVIFVNL